MKIVHAASELYPYIKTGGLADAVGSLTRQLALRGHEVSVFLPAYRSVMEHPEVAEAKHRLRLRIEMGDRFYTGDVYSFSPATNLTVYLVAREEFFDRKNPYGTKERDYEDNDERFIFFCKGVVETLRILQIGADIVHGHDWQAALLPVLVRYEERVHGVTLALRTIFTIHNIAFPGIFPMKSFALTNLPDELMGIDALEYYGQINLLKGGILFADRVTTVSPTYSKEIQTPEFGCGLDGVVATRAADLCGLINGIDTRVWNPAVDKFIPANYSVNDLSGKAVCRAHLLKHFGFTEKFKGPVYGMVCRLTEQKGLDLVLANKSFFVEENCRLIVLGTGSKHYEDALRALAAEHPNKIALSARLDEAMSHLIEGGSDFFLMPSLFEPSGLNQMYSQIYGTIPIASQVGGLVDTVIDADAHPERGTGLTFPPNREAFRDALQRSLKLFSDKARLAVVQKHGMTREFGWEKAVLDYERLYQTSL
ncbi:MAG TPA: glycogen synthase GlgA [Opitutaceae bacterium]|nr:glycogen synthase GlgA [Opitutaceae bacterium]